MEHKTLKRKPFTKEQREQIMYYYTNNIYSAHELNNMFGCTVTVRLINTIQEKLNLSLYLNKN